MRTDFGRCAHLFGHRKRALEQLRKRGAQRTGGIRSAHGVFELAQNLGFTQHHGVEPAGDAKCVARCIVVLELVGVRAQILGRNAAALGQPSQRLLHRCFITGAVNLGAVAGRNNRGLGAMGHGLAQCFEFHLELVGREREAAPHVQRSRGVIDA